jgi:DNA-binding FadR family transcriptional regulator
VRRPGDLLEGAIETFGVSRTACREAIRILVFCLRFPKW